MGWQSWGAATVYSRDRDRWRVVLNGLRCPAGYDEDKYVSAVKPRYFGLSGKKSC